MSDEPDSMAPEEDDVAPTPQVLVYSMGPELIGATITVATDPDGPNVGDRYKVQLVMARDQTELTNRIVSVLVAQFGMTQDDAQVAVDAATPLLPTEGGAVGDFVPLDGSVPMTGPLTLFEDPAGDVPLQAATKHYVDHVDNMKMNVFGVSDGSEAPTGEIGEYLVVSNTAGVTTPSNVSTMVCQLDLTAGDWEVWGSVDFRPDAGVSPNMVAASVSLYPDALPTDDDLMGGVGILSMITTSSLTTGQRQMLATGQCRANPAAPLTLYLIAQTTLGGSGIVTAKGYICARRQR